MPVLEDLPDSECLIELLARAERRQNHAAPGPTGAGHARRQATRAFSIVRRECRELRQQALRCLAETSGLSRAILTRGEPHGFRHAGRGGYGEMRRADEGKKLQKVVGGERVGADAPGRRKPVAEKGRGRPCVSGRFRGAEIGRLAVAGQPGGGLESGDQDR